MKGLFHFAFPVKDVNATRNFYTEILGCTLGRTAHNWVDINFFGHQLTAHREPGLKIELRMNSLGVPQRHFGAILSLADWKRMKARLEEKEVPFFIEPRMVFGGEVGEQMSLFVKDPSGYAIEFKAFENQDRVFKAS